MEVINARNVNDAYVMGMELLRRVGVPQKSRAGDVLVCPTPVTTVYDKPMERVLFDPGRDANPFFHLFEPLWMLAGRNDARWLDLFVKDFSSRFAEIDGTIHGAYGYRWRREFGFDQLDEIVHKLRKDPNDRQAVLQMWDTSNYHGEGYGEQFGCDDLRGEWKDRPCNTTAYFRVRTVREVIGPVLGPDGPIDITVVGSQYTNMAPPKKVLDLTVCCRSNDLIWGAYGANAVHFSVLLEYMAVRIGVDVGRYYQISNNFHGYLDTLKKVGTPMEKMGYGAHAAVPTPIVTDPITFDKDLRSFMEWTQDYEHGQGPHEYPGNPWFSNTAEPLFAIAERWRAKDRETAWSLIDDDVFDIAPDWRKAVREWMERRTKQKVGA